MKKSTMLFCSALVLSSVVAPTAVTLAEDYSSQIQQQSRDIEQQQQQINQNNQLLESLQAQKEAKSSDLAGLVSEMEKTEQEVTNLKNAIQSTQAEVSKLEDEINYLTDAISKRAEKISTQARYMQTDSPGNTLVEAIWSSESIVEAFEKIFAMAEVTNASQATMNQQKEDKKTVETKHQQLNLQLATQGQRAAELQQLTVEQATRRSQIEATLTQLQSQSDVANSQNSELQSQIAKAQTLIASYKEQEEAQRRAAQQSALAAQIARENNNVASNVVRTQSTRNISSTAPSQTLSTPSITPDVTTSGFISGGGNFVAPNPSYIAAVNGGVPGQCTWYVYNRLAQLGAPIPYRMMGNGGEWGSYARSYGYSVTNTPKAGTAVSFSSSVPGMSYYGHVAFVERVNSDGSIVVSEMNVQGEFVISTRTISASTAALGQYIDFGL